MKTIPRATVCAFLAGYYSAKLQGLVTCDYDAGRRVYAIHGRALPSNPRVPGYTVGRTWECLDYITPAQARELMTAPPQWYDIGRMYP